MQRRNSGVRGAPPDAMGTVGAGASATIGPETRAQQEHRMTRFFRIQVDEAALTDELFGFVTDPAPVRNQRPVIAELHDFNPEMVDVLEHMVLDGVDRREDVQAYVRYALGELFTF